MDRVTHCETAKPGPTQRYVRLGLCALVVLIAGFGSWAAFTNVSAAVITRGHVELSEPTLFIQSLHGGMVASIPAKEGASVREGAPLLFLDTTDLQNERTALAQKLLELRIRRARIEAELSGSDIIEFRAGRLARSAPGLNVSQVLDRHRELLGAIREAQDQDRLLAERKSAEIALQMEAVQAQIAAANTQISLVREQLAAQSQLAERSLVPANTLLPLQSSEAELRGKTGALEARLAQLREMRAQLEDGLAQKTSARHADQLAKLRDLEFREDELVQQWGALSDRMSAMVIRAPASGTVLWLTELSAGSVVLAGQDLMQIVPSDRTIRIAARINPQEIHRISDSRDVRVKIPVSDAPLPIRATGTITSISPGIRTDQVTGERYYQAMIDLAPTETSGRLTKEEIMPGAPVRVVISIDSQPTWSYLAKPLLPYFANAFREN